MKKQKNIFIFIRVFSWYLIIFFIYIEDRNLFDLEFNLVDRFDYLFLYKKPKTVKWSINLWTLNSLRLIDRDILKTRNISNERLNIFFI